MAEPLLPPNSESLASTHPLSPIKAWLNAQAIKLQSWDEIIGEILLRLGPTGLENFRRLHRHFTAYPTSDTLKHFYDFAYGHGLGDLLVNYRARRLEAILLRLDAVLTPGLRLLEYGTGTGVLLHWIQQHKAPKYLLGVDVSPHAQNYLEPLQIDFEVGLQFRSQPPGQGRKMAQEAFDYWLLADSLGEVHADEDQELLQAAAEWGRLHQVGKTKALAKHTTVLGHLLEERYGYVEKIKSLVTLGLPCVNFLLFEPIDSPALQTALVESFTQGGFCVKQLNQPRETVALHIWSE